MIKQSASTPALLLYPFITTTSLLNFHIDPDFFVGIILGFVHTQYLHIIMVLFAPYQTLHFNLFFLPYWVG